MACIIRIVKKNKIVPFIINDKIPTLSEILRKKCQILERSLKYKKPTTYKPTNKNIFLPADPIKVIC